MKTFRFIFILLIIANVQIVLSNEYDIKFERPLHEGAKYKMSSYLTYNAEREMQIDGIAVDKDNKYYYLEFSGVVEVLEVNEKGHEKKVKIKIDKCIKREKGAELILISNDKIVIEESNNGSIELKIDNNKISNEVTQILLPILPFQEKTLYDADTVFGTKTRKNIGDVWNINKKAVIEEFSMMNYNLTEKEVEGTVSIKDKRKVNNIECLDIVVEILLKKPPPGWWESLSSVDLIKEGETKTFSHGLYPISIEVGPLEQEFKVSKMMVTEGIVDNKKITIIMTEEQIVNGKFDRINFKY